MSGVRKVLHGSSRLAPALNAASLRRLQAPPRGSNVRHLRKAPGLLPQFFRGFALLLGLVASIAIASPVMAESKKLVSQREAARILRVDARTIGRMHERGELERDEETKKYFREEIEDLAEMQEERSKNSAEAQALQSLTSALAQANEHTQKMVDLFTRPIVQLLELSQQQQEALGQRMERGEALNLKMMEELGAFLLRKEEINQEREDGESRRETMKGAAEMLKQAGGLALARKSGTDPSALALKRFFSSLSQDELQQMTIMYWMLDEGPKRDAFGALLKMVGLSIPPNPEEPESNGAEGE